MEQAPLPALDKLEVVEVKCLAVYTNAHRYYSRIGSMLYAYKSTASRTLHVMNSFAQMAMTIALVVGLIEVKGIEYKTPCIVVTFLAMRIFAGTFSCL